MSALFCHCRLLPIEDNFMKKFESRRNASFKSTLSSLNLWACGTILLLTLGRKICSRSSGVMEVKFEGARFPSDFQYPYRRNYNNGSVQECARGPLLPTYIGLHRPMYIYIAPKIVRTNLRRRVRCGWDLVPRAVGTANISGFSGNHVHDACER